MSGGAVGPAPDEGARRAEYVGIGCVTAPAGFFGGGMIATFVGMIVGNVRNCKPPEGEPICDLWSYVIPGAIAGLVLLPSVSLWLFRRSRRSAPRNST